MSNNLVCFGDVVKLSTKSAFVDGEVEAGFLGFLEQKKEMLLVVPPVKGELKAKFLEAEFVVSAVRGDKQPLPGTPLNYKQPFVLKTSDGSGYSLNNKTPNMSEVVSLREMGIKGEMYVAVEKEGFGQETHVHHGDLGVELHVVDSNRIRKTYDNVPLKHIAKPKSDAPGGFVTCATNKKAQVLTFTIVKVEDKTETRKFIKDPVFRRASQLLLDPKADETSEASVLESPSRAGSIVTTGPLVVESPVPSAPSSPTAAATNATTEPKVETPETEETAAPIVGPTPTVTAVEAPVVATTTSSATTVTTTTSAETTPAVAAETATTTQSPATRGVDPAALTAQLLQTVESGTVEVSPKPDAEAPSVVGEELVTALATIELSAASVSEADNVDGSVPVHDKLAVHTHHPHQVTSPAAGNATEAATTDVSELETLGGLPSVPEEHLETACAGKCAIM